MNPEKIQTPHMLLVMIPQGNKNQPQNDRNRRDNNHHHTRRIDQCGDQDDQKHDSQNTEKKFKILFGRFPANTQSFFDGEFVFRHKKQLIQV